MVSAFSSNSQQASVEAHSPRCKTIPSVGNDWLKPFLCVFYVPNMQSCRKLYSQWPLVQPGLTSQNGPSWELQDALKKDKEFSSSYILLYNLLRDLKAQVRFLFEGGVEVLIHSQCIIYSRWQSACPQFGEITEAKQCTAVDRVSGKIHFSYPQKINISLVYCIFRI